jgi:hypothetical protein
LNQPARPNAKPEASRLSVRRQSHQTVFVGHCRVELDGNPPPGKAVAPDLLGQAGFAGVGRSLKDDKPARLQDSCTCSASTASKVLFQK